MGIPLDVYFVYRLDTQNCGSQFVCFTAHRPGYSNAIQFEEDAAEGQLDANRDQRLREAIQAVSKCGVVRPSEMVGCSYEAPVGEDMYDSTPRTLDIWLAEQRYGRPWVILGTAESEEAFWKAVQEDSDLVACAPHGSAQKLSVLYLG